MNKKLFYDVEVCASYVRIPDRAKWKVLVGKALYAGLAGIFNFGWA